jgi:hypothetical protein
MTLEEMNPGTKRTDGHAERKALGLKDTEATPITAKTAEPAKPAADVKDWKPAPPKAK